MEAVANKKWKAEGEVETRYRRARQEWDRRMGSAVAQARNWRLATLLSLGLVLVSLVGTIYLGAQPKVVPHIVQVDRIGAPTYLGLVGQSAREYKPSDASLKYHLRRFIAATRTISSDPAVMKRNWIDAYTLITQSAARRTSCLRHCSTRAASACT
jgi:type IV secretion system protein VirB5